MNKFLFTATGISFGLVFYYLSSDQGHHENQKLSKEQVLLVLNDLDKEFEKVLVLIATQANALKDKNCSLSQKSLKSLIKNHFPIEQNIKNTEIQVYKNHKILEKNLKSAIKTEFLADPDISLLQQKITQRFENAYKGLVLNENIWIPENLTPSLTLKILSEIYDCELFLAHKKKEMKDKYRGDDDSSDDYIYEISFEIELDIESCKEKIWNKNNVLALNSNFSIILRNALLNYRIASAGFKERLAEIEEAYNNTISKILDQTLSTEELETLEHNYEEAIS